MCCCSVRHLKSFPGRRFSQKLIAIVLVLITPVLRETDRQKGGQGRLASRARKVNSWIGKLLDAGELAIRTPSPGPGVTIIADDAIKPSAELSQELDFDHPDDAIVGTVASFQSAHPESEVALLSMDNAVLFTAKRVGVAFRRVPEEWLLPAETNEEQKRIKALEGELARLKKSEPQCVIEPNKTPWSFCVERFEPLTDKQICKLMESLVDQFPPESDFGPTEASTRRPSSGNTFLREDFTPASAAEIQDYQEARYPKWLKSCESIWKTLHEKLNARVPLPQISVSLCNKGSRPAEDVWVEFCLKSGGVLLVLPKTEEEPISFETSNGMVVEVRPGDDHVWLPAPPSPPRGRWTKRHPIDPLGLGRASSLDYLVHARAMPDVTRHLRPVAPRDPNSFYYRSGMRPEHPRPSTELTCEQFRHQVESKTVVFDLFVVRSESRATASGALTVELHAANLSSPATSTIPFRIAFTSGPTFEEAEAILESLQLRSKSGRG